MPTDTSDPACGEVPPALAGQWTKTIGLEDLPPELFDMDIGVFVMTLGPGHYMRIDVDDDHRGTDTDLCWTADRVAFVSYRDDCSGDALGIYAWALRNDELDLTEVSDECFWRPLATTIDTWERVGR
jgi:hypothetical protein